MKIPTRDTTELVQLRHELHANAELAGQETETGRILHGFIGDYRPDRLIAELGGTGLAAVFEGRQRGPTIMFRSEIDAVPVQEISDFDHRSRHAGVSHKCGHDGHAAIVAGLAATLARRPPERGRVVLLFQPAEETGCGARNVLEDPRFGSIAPDWIFALHNLPRAPFAEIQIKSGPFAAGSVGAKLQLKGRTSHAAYPEQGLSPAVAAAQLIQELGKLPSTLGFGDGLARITVVHARIGDPAFGTTPGLAEVMATLRSDRDEVLEDLRAAVVERAHHVARSNGLEHSHSWTDAFPVTANHPDAVEIVEAVAEERNVTVARREAAFPWSEDFGWFTRNFPGAIFGLGSGAAHPALHSPNYDFPDRLLPVGLALFEGIVERILGSAGKVATDDDLG